MISTVAEHWLRAASTSRPFGETPELVYALRCLGWGSSDTGDMASARLAFEEASEVAYRIADAPLTAQTLQDLAEFERHLGNYERSLELNAEALSISEDIGDAMGAMAVEGNVIVTLAGAGDAAEAHRRSRELIDRILASRTPGLIANFASNHAERLLDVGEPEAAARLMGTAYALRSRLGVKDNPIEGAEYQEFLLKCQQALGAEDFQRAYAAGQATMAEDLLIELRNL